MSAMGSATWPLFFLCLTLSAALFGQWVLQRGRRQLLASTIFLAAAGAIFIADKLIITETKRVEAGIYGLAKAFQAGDVERCLDFFSAQDKADRQLVGQAAGMVEIEGPIRISDMTVEMSSAESRAIAKFRASATAKYQGHSDRGHTRWELTWQREGNDWKIVRVRRLRFIGEGEASPLSVME
jgi:ketosteroid isomerase-like protein